MTIDVLDPGYFEMDRAQLLEQVVRLRGQLDYVRRSVHFGCLTRQALELRLLEIDWSQPYLAVVWDIDNLKAFNARHGIVASSQLHGAVIQARTRDLLCAGQWYSGDEFLALLPAKDAHGFARRLLDGLHTIGSSATIVIAKITRDTPITDQVDALLDTALQSKLAGRKDRIIDRTMEAYNDHD